MERQALDRRGMSAPGGARYAAFYGVFCRVRE